MRIGVVSGTGRFDGCIVLELRWSQALSMALPISWPEFKENFPGYKKTSAL